jgi:adenine-specific DNA methylase
MDSFPTGIHPADTGTSSGAVNGAGIPLSKLNKSTGRPKGARNLNAKHPSSIARAFSKAGLHWQEDFALAIKGNNRARIKLWLRLLPYLVTTTNKTRVKKWRGKASRAAIIALDALEGRK